MPGDISRILQLPALVRCERPVEILFGEHDWVERENVLRRAFAPYLPQASFTLIPGWPPSFDGGAYGDRYRLRPRARWPSIGLRPPFSRSDTMKL
jgi:hypothetical protein